MGVNSVPCEISQHLNDVVESSDRILSTLDLVYGVRNDCGSSTRKELADPDSGPTSP